MDCVNYLEHYGSPKLSRTIELIANINIIPSQKGSHLNHLECVTF